MQSHGLHETTSKNVTIIDQRRLQLAILATLARTMSNMFNQEPDVSGAESGCFIAVGGHSRHTRVIEVCTDGYGPRQVILRGSSDERMLYLLTKNLQGGNWTAKQFTATAEDTSIVGFADNLRVLA